LLKLIVDSIDTWPPHAWTAGDRLAAFEWDDWHWGPISPLLIWDEYGYPVRFPMIGEFVLTEWWTPAADSGVVDSELVKMVYTVDVWNHKDSNGDTWVTVCDYLLLHFNLPAALDSQTCWYHVEEVGASYPGYSTYILKLKAEVPPATPTLCQCDCHADPQCDGNTDVLDVVLAVNVAFRGAPPIIDPNPLCPYTDTDCTCDGVTNVLDVVHFVNVAFRGGDPAVEFCDPCP